MQAINAKSSLGKAPKACKFCRSRKKKCDRALPRCGLCARKNRPCKYWKLNLSTTSHSTIASTAETQWHSSLLDQAQPQPQVIDLTTILFLDHDLLRLGQVETLHAIPAIPQHVLQLLGSLDEIRLTADKFFGHIHQWMPFISKKRFYDLYIQPPFHSRPDIALLLLALKLITTLPLADSPNPRTTFYHAVKHFYLEVEGSFSLLVLQAGILVALYELGHGIYPAAFLSIGQCARYAHTLGLNTGHMVPATKVLTLVEVEERRRVWWAIVILDRFVSIGCPGRPFVTADPRLDDLLPGDDAAFDLGTIELDDFSTLSSPKIGHMSKFSLLCQAAHLLGQVLQHVSRDSADQDIAWVQLDRTLQSMLAAALDVDRPDYDQITFIYSALVALYTPYLQISANTKDSNRAFSQRARDVLHQIIGRINANLVDRQCFLGRDSEDVSPWGLYFAYRVCGMLMRPAEKAPHGAEVLKSLREAFQTISVRWHVASVYLELLEAQKALHLGA
ncbi:hypothetical protein TGAMA5MH_04620 [Trichoderma gamsii]|uniref:Zn(2)-C6 fungal-type domain-containing protein n=1 Tax=Trichoderma gamsii TaxID=398673 RepID=A0A2K0TDN8_9HYPO|nr:hypothetical protein TGAMA5MH_04620 [Trichoderma gamsii]